MNWEKTTFGALVLDSRGGTSFRTKEYSLSGTPVLTKGDVKPFGRVEHGGKYVDTDYAKSKGYRFTKPGDLIVTTRDLTLAADFLGLVSSVPIDQAYLVNQGATIFAIDESRVDRRYFTYWCSGAVYREHIKNNHVGSTQIHIRQDDLFAAPVLLPALSEQKAIASVLGSLDAKIELNRRMNETLESMARAIFKSWFVDFDPVRAKMDGRLPAGMDQATADLFPDSFEQSELGPVPHGWPVIPLGEVLELKRGYDLPKRSRLPGLIPIYSSAGLSGFHSEHKVAGPTVVTGRYGTIGNVYFVNGKSWPLNTTLYVRDFKGSEPRYAYYVVKAINFHAYLDKAAVPGINRNDVHREPTIAPPKVLQSRFTEAIQPMWRRHECNAVQCETLAALRDTLLPKLLSGELRVAEAEREVEAVV